MAKLKQVFPEKLYIMSIDDEYIAYKNIEDCDDGVLVGVYQLVESGKIEKMITVSIVK